MESLTERFRVAEVSVSEPVQARLNPRNGCSILQRFEPFDEWLVAPPIPVNQDSVRRALSHDCTL